MSEKPPWYDQSLYEQAWENYRNEDENYRTILTQYLVFAAAFIYAASQADNPSTVKILGFVGGFVSILAVFYIGRITRYSRAWLKLKKSSIGDSLDNKELALYKRSKQRKLLGLVSSIPGYVLITFFPFAGLVLFVLMILGKMFP